MNREKAQTIINKIVEDYRATAYKGGRNQYAASKKNLAIAEELGILDMIPNAPYENHIGNTEIQLIIKAATDAGKQVGGMVDGEGDVVTTTAHPLYQAIHEADEPTPESQEIELDENNTLVIEPKDGGAVTWCITTMKDGMYFESDDYTAATVEQAIKDARDYYEANNADDDPADRAELDAELYYTETLAAVMTPAQIEREFKLSSGVIRNMLDNIPHSRPDQRTILIPRAYAEERWGNRKEE